MRRVLVGLGALALLALPAVTVGATLPTVTGPTAASLIASQPAWTIVNPPTGERVNLVVFSKKSTVDSRGILDTQYGESFFATETGAAATRLHKAGKYFWQFSWTAPIPEGEFVGEGGVTAPVPFEIPAVIKSLKVVKASTSSNSTGAFMKGAVSSNVSSLETTCKVSKGTKTLSTVSMKVASYSTFKDKEFSCFGLKVKNKYIGQKVKFTATVKSGRVTKSVSKEITAS